MLSIARAALLADAAHSGQVDKVGTPYIEHPAAVAGTVARVTGGDPTQVVTAWLHDVVEDTDVTLDEIRDQFGDRVATAVDALTHRPHEPNADYLARVAANPDALVVKYADLANNTHPDRVALIADHATQERLAAKYERAYARLAELAPESVWLREATRAVMADVVRA